MKYLIPLPWWFRLGIWLMVIMSSGSDMAFAQAKPSSLHNVPVGEPVESARVIVKFKQNSTMLRKHALSVTTSATEMLVAVTARANSLGARLGLNLRAGRALNEQTQVVGASGLSSASLAARLAAEADVEYAVVDQRRKHLAVPNDPLYSQGPPINRSTGGPSSGQWYLRTSTVEFASSINATSAWDLTTGSSNIVVAILDSGVLPEHPDLAGRLLAGYDLVSDLPTGNDGNGWDVDASDPGDWVSTTETNDPSGPFYQCDAEHSSWHGTMTTSLIGATANNGIGMAGVAWGVKLLPVRVLGKCGGYDSDIIAGMEWAAGLPIPGIPANPSPARVINMSLGSSGACPQSYIDAIKVISGTQYPAVIVASAGNSSGLAVGTPANCPGVIAVAGLRHTGTKVGYSDLGPEISISAPAGNCVNPGVFQPCLYPILAATNTGTTKPVASAYTDAFNYSTGTSFSAPLVAGTVALMLSAQPSLTPNQIKEVLKSTARTFPSGVAGTIPNCHAPDSNEQLECSCTASTCGAGMLDAAAAVAAVRPVSYVVEFYNSTLDTFFITADSNEAAAIDQGSAGQGWSRTGNIFKTGGSTSVCRFYGSPSPGPNSHFYTVDAGECAYLKQLEASTPATQKRWNFESLDFISAPPTNGACSSGTVPVYRAYNNGVTRNIDSSHRITRNLAAIQQVVARGWTNEGVVMCAPL